MALWRNWQTQRT